ncbi:hypothetical protein LguiB_020810 [Lonicera macranthoides]
MVSIVSGNDIILLIIHSFPCWQMRRFCTAGSCSVCNSERNKMPIFKGFEGSALESGGWALSDLLKLLDTCGLSKRRLQIYSAARRKLQKVNYHPPAQISLISLHVLKPELVGLYPYMQSVHLDG